MNDNFKPKLILVPTDFSETAFHALRFASAMALRLDAHLLVMHADFFIPPIDFMAAPTGEFSGSRNYLISEAREQLLQHAETNIDPRVPFDTRLIVRSPVDAILDIARETGAELIVMGTHGRTAVRRLLVGSITETTMRKSPVPVIAVNCSSPDTGSIRKILCPVMYTAASVSALRHAAALVNARSSPIVLLRAIDDVDDPRAYAQELRRLRDWVPPDLVDRCEIKIVPAHATVESILAVANVTHPDLIVFGVEPNRSVAEVMRGTIAERVMQHSNCPVLTIAAVHAPIEVTTKVVEMQPVY